MTKEGGPVGPPSIAYGVLLETPADRGDQLTARGVAGELPHEGAAETLLLGVGHLAGDRRRGVVAPPVVAAQRVGRAADGARGRAGVLQDLVVLDARLVGAGRAAGGRAAGCGLSDARPAAA